MVMNVYLKHRHRLAILWLAQDGICAGCGRPVRKRSATPGQHSDAPDDPTFDHVATAISGGSNGLRNGILKHRACNEARGSRPPTGCDHLWHEVVRVKLARARQDRRKTARRVERELENRPAQLRARGGTMASIWPNGDKTE